MPAGDHRLNTLEVARFVAEGYLRFDALVPEDLNERVIEELSRLSQVKIPQAVGIAPEGEMPGRPESLTPLSQCYPPPSVLGEVLQLPSIQGIIYLTRLEQRAALLDGQAG